MSQVGMDVKTSTVRLAVGFVWHEDRLSAEDCNIYHNSAFGRNGACKPMAELFWWQLLFESRQHR
jgi:hypothetical protein